MNGWIRIGIVVSAIWILTIAIYCGYEHHMYSIYLDSRFCGYLQDSNELQECVHKLHKGSIYFVEKYYHGYSDGVTSFNFWIIPNTLFYIVSIVPLVTGWMLGFIAPHIVRWISEGFNSKETS